jgi:SAM-dependent methyltransferase
MSNLVQALQQHYDECPYFSFAYEQSAPDHLAAVAHLFGLDAPDVATASVLELGCASGGNMIPFAVRYPHARVVGIDLSAAQIGEGRRRIAALGLKNVELLQRDLMSLSADFGKFDYIVCHGVYSWVPEPVQQAILHICRHNLAPQGIAYVGYKTYPGWKAHEIVRDAMLLRAGERTGERERVAWGRGMIEFLHQHARRDSVLAAAIGQDWPTIETGDDAYLVHDFMEVCNAPCYFKEFVARAGMQGLVYLGDADMPTMFASNFGPEVATPLLQECGHSQIELEQFLDFVSDRSFRRTLLVHHERQQDLSYQLQDARLRDLQLAASLTCVDAQVQFDGSPQAFRAHNGNTIVLGDPVAKLAARELSAAWPFTLGVAALRRAIGKRLKEEGSELADTKSDADAKLMAFVSALVIQGAGRYRLQPLPKRKGNPRVPPAARRYALELPPGQTAHTFNDWHEPVVLDAVAQRVLPFLDGEHTRAQLLAILEAAVVEERLVLPEAPADAAGGDRAPDVLATLSTLLDQALMRLCA